MTKTQKKILKLKWKPKYKIKANSNFKKKHYKRK